MTRYAYDPQTFRLARLRTERYTKPDRNALTYQPYGAPLQDFALRLRSRGKYHPRFSDRTPESGISDTSLLGTDASIVAFPTTRYTACYRPPAASAIGRRMDPPWDDQPRCTDITRTTRLHRGVPVRPGRQHRRGYTMGSSIMADSPASLSLASPAPTVWRR